MEKFIITSNAETAQEFISAGFKLISETAGVFTFLNTNTNFNFSNIESKQYRFTNILSI